jgi:TPR repeat protein
VRLRLLTLQRGWMLLKEETTATAMKEWKPLAEQEDASARFNLGLMYAIGSNCIHLDEYLMRWSGEFGTCQLH